MNCELLRKAELHGRLDSCLRQSEDAIDRAQDQLEDDAPDLTSLGYVITQLSIAKEKLTSGLELAAQLTRLVDCELDIDNPLGTAGHVAAGGLSLDTFTSRVSVAPIFRFPPPDEELLVPICPDCGENMKPRARYGPFPIFYYCMKCLKAWWM
jgi:hypothetical protein